MKMSLTCKDDSENTRKKLREINQQFYQCLQDASKLDAEPMPSSQPPTQLLIDEKHRLTTNEAPQTA